ncbi:hypothetical protein [Flavobacterium plurextorum]|uniref:hypothetical protein n=1 Tax=Flavobacterium plurextorum TaxID=1114867 RepID=UPI000F50BA40|nr:hypothetical protein [Flavobacterium plurextorum]
MKLVITIFLLILIAISVQTYFFNGDSHSTEAVSFGTIITMDILLIFVYIRESENLLYRRIIGALLVCFVIISVICWMLFLYVMGLNTAFRN